jgi:hypothetical protein
MPSRVASRRMFDRMGSVVLAGTLAATATSPSWSCSRVMVSFMPLLNGGYKQYYSTLYIN